MICETNKRDHKKKKKEVLSTQLVCQEIYFHSTWRTLEITLVKPQIAFSELQDKWVEILRNQSNIYKI